MAQYRCYHLDTRDHIIGFEAFDLSSDSEACARAAKIAAEKDWRSYSVWNLDRKIDCGIFKL